MRSRYIQPGKEAAGESEVYLDENFLECMHVGVGDVLIKLLVILCA